MYNLIILCQNVHTYGNNDARRKTNYLRSLGQSSASLRRSYSYTLGARTRGLRSFLFEWNLVEAVVRLHSYRSIYGTAIPSPSPRAFQHLSAARAELLSVPTVVFVRDLFSHRLCLSVHWRCAPQTSAGSTADTAGCGPAARAPRATGYVGRMLRVSATPVPC